MLTLTPGKVPLHVLEQVWRECLPVRLHHSCQPAIVSAAERIRAAAQGDIPIYGVNTGFGKLASIRIANRDTEMLQRNLILSHCAGVGEPTPPSITRLMMILKLISLGRGASGVRLSVIELLEQMLKRDVIPIIPSQGSVGASGDLAPLAHMAAVMIGEGQATWKDTKLPGDQALAQAGLSPLVLGPKEGLALVNGTQFSTAYALVGLFRAHHAAQSSLLSTALSIDAAKASTAPLHPEIHTLRGHPGQIEAARLMRHLLEGSAIRASHSQNDPRVQDPYCMRCQPQVVGAAMDLLGYAATSLHREANAATDNPLVLQESEDIVSGGNFHAEPVAFAADMIALAMAEVGSIAQRRVALLVDPNLSFDLPPFLAATPGLHSGLMIAEVTSAALMSENKHLANPCSTDSTPTSANQEDHVSMAAHGARRLVPMANNLVQIIGIEVFCAAEGIRFRAPLTTSPPLQAALKRFRADVPPLKHDRLLAPCLDIAARLVEGSELLQATGLSFPAILSPQPTKEIFQ
ncbi:MAG: histidine ammonia-lyase [Myxococcales bacterium]|nr:histidine ammonia-lyase [Myxococcales bacterium]